MGVQLPGGVEAVSRRDGLMGPRAGTLTVVLGRPAAAVRIAALLAFGARPAPRIVAGRMDGLDEPSLTRALERLRRVVGVRPLILTTCERSVALRADRVVVLVGETPLADGPPVAVLDDGLLALVDRGG